MDFKFFPKNKNGFNIIYIVINRLKKRVYLIYYYKIITAKNIVRFFILNIYRIYEPLNIIVLNRES
jgi:hypothetical protein